MYLHLSLDLEKLCAQEDRNTYSVIANFMKIGVVETMLY
jgi:hypothetical protein